MSPSTAIFCGKILNKIGRGFVNQSISSTSSSPMILTPDQRLRVFVSSTLQELAEERAAAQEPPPSLRLTPILFELGARPHPPRDLYRAYLEHRPLPGRVGRGGRGAGRGGAFGAPG